MSFWQRFLYWLRPRVIVVRGAQLTERQINEALAGVSETHPVWLAVHQLIDTAERNAWSDAAGVIREPTTTAGYVGGSRHLDLLRQDLQIRRKKGLQAIEQGRPKS